jgi:hypothetical protein
VKNAAAMHSLQNALMTRDLDLRMRRLRTKVGEVRENVGGTVWFVPQRVGLAVVKLFSQRATILPFIGCLRPQALCHGRQRQRETRKPVQLPPFSEGAAMEQSKVLILVVEDEHLVRELL